MRAEPETRGLSSFYLRCGRALKEPQRLGGAVHIAMRAQLLLVAHTLLACLVAVHASGNAFSWLATEHAESEINLPQHTSRLRETPNAFIPIQIDNICLPSAALKSRPGTAISFSLILLWIVSVTGVYLLGWHCGLSQAKARHVLQQATAADHQDEQAKAASTAEESAASQAVALTTLDHSGDSQHASHLLADSSSLSSVESASSGVQQDIDVAAAGLFHDAQPGSSNSCADALDQALGNSALAQAVQAPTEGAPAALDPEPLGSHAEALPQQDENTCPAAAHSAVSPQQNPCQTLPSVQAAPDPDSSQPEIAEVAIMASASRILDRILYQMRVHMEDLSLSHRIQLVPAVVQALGVAVHHHHQLEDQRLQGIANDQSASRNTIIQEGQVNDRTWRQAKLQQKQLQDFKLQIADGLMCGLIVMLLGMLYFGAAFGYYDSKLELCNTRRFSFFARLWGPLDVVVCYISATMDLVGSVAAMLVTVYAVKRFGLLTDSIAKPMTGLVLFLGVGCGLLGKYVIGRLGGDSFVWLSVYEVWVFQQVLAVWFVQALHACLQADRTVWQQFRLPMYMLFTGLVMPFVVAACAFWHSLYKQAFQ